MKLSKMRRILGTMYQPTNFYAHHVPDGTLLASAGGELRIEFDSQPMKDIHDYLLSRGFVYTDDGYNYRPK